MRRSAVSAERGSSAGELVVARRTVRSLSVRLMRPRLRPEKTPENTINTRIVPYCIRLPTVESASSTSTGRSIWLAARTRRDSVPRRRVSQRGEARRTGQWNQRSSGRRGWDARQRWCGCAGRGDGKRAVEVDVEVRAATRERTRERRNSAQCLPIDGWRCFIDAREAADQQQRR